MLVFFWVLRSERYGRLEGAIVQIKYLFSPKEIEAIIGGSGELMII